MKNETFDEVIQLVRDIITSENVGKEKERCKPRKRREV